MRLMAFRNACNCQLIASRLKREPDLLRLMGSVGQYWEAYSAGILGIS